MGLARFSLACGAMSVWLRAMLGLAMAVVLLGRSTLKRPNLYARLATLWWSNLYARLATRSNLYARLATLAMAAFLLGQSTGRAQQQPAPLDSAAYLLVIDHSGSMSLAMPSGKTRWEEMQDEAIEFLRHVPLESRIWIAVFSGTLPNPEVPPFNTERDRQALIERIETAYGPPEGGTALYDTLGMAFEEADRLSLQHPGRHISVLTYTDGDDQHSRDWTAKKLQDRFEKLVDKNRNLYLFITRIDDEGAPIEEVVDHPHALKGTFQKRALPLSMEPSSVVLKNPKLHPRQTFDLAFGGSDGIWELLDGTSLSFQFTPDADQAISATVAAVPFRKGRVPVTIEIANPQDLVGDQEYLGKLDIIYPTLARHEVKAGAVTQIRFQKEERPTIYDLLPRDGATFAAGQPVHFWANTLQGTQVLWQFGDGTSASGPEAQHVYNTAGQRSVSVSVLDDPRVGPTKREFSIEILDIGVSVDPLQGVIVEGVPFTFRSTARGPIERFEWIIDGQNYAGRDAGQDGTATGSQISYTFDRPADHLVSVVGYSEKAVVQSEERVVGVLAKPSIEVSSPSPSPLRKPVEFKLLSPPGWTAVVWDFDDGETDASNNPNPIHQYTMRGSFQPRANVTWDDGTVSLAKSTVNVIAEPPRARPLVRVGNEEVARVTVGSTVKLDDDSAGDVVERIWEHKGPDDVAFVQLPTGQVSLSVDSIGEHRIKFHTVGPPDREGHTLSDVKEVLFQVSRPPDAYLFWIAAMGALGCLGTSWWLLQGNSPRAWRIYFSNHGPPDEESEPCVQVREGWSWLRKKGEIPMKQFFKECEYWSSGLGAKESIHVTASKGGSEWLGLLTYSGDGNDSVRTMATNGDRLRTDYQWRDNRCPEELYKTFHMRLVKQRDDNAWLSAALLLAIAGCLAVALWGVYQYVFR